MEEFVAQAAEEEIELRIGVGVRDLLPGGQDGLDALEIAAEAGEQIGGEIFGFADLDGRVGGLALGDELDELVLAVFEQILVNGEVGRDVDGAALEHADHGRSGIAEAAQRGGEGVEGAVEALNQQRAHDRGELEGDAVGVLVFLLQIRSEKGERPVAVVSQPDVGPRGEHLHGAVVERLELGRERVEDVPRALDLGEAHALLFEVVLVVRVVVKVGACAAHGDLADDLRPDVLVDGDDSGARLRCSAPFRFAELAFSLGKVLEIADAEVERFRS